LGKREGTSGGGERLDCEVRRRAGIALEREKGLGQEREGSNGLKDNREVQRNQVSSKVIQSISASLRGQLVGFSDVASWFVTGRMGVVSKSASLGMRWSAMVQAKIRRSIRVPTP